MSATVKLSYVLQVYQALHISPCKMHAYLIRHAKYTHILFRYVKCMRYLTRHVKCKRFLICHLNASVT